MPLARSGLPANTRLSGSVHFAPEDFVRLSFKENTLQQRLKKDEIGVLPVPTLASGAWPDRGRPGPKPGLKAEVRLATSQALAGLAKG